MPQESTSAFFQRIALEYIDRRLKEYVLHLELVAQKARAVADGNPQDRGEIEELKEALEELEKVAS